MRGILRLEMLCLSGGEQTRVEEEEDKLKKGERC